MKGRRHGASNKTGNKVPSIIFTGYFTLSKIFFYFIFTSEY